MTEAHNYGVIPLMTKPKPVLATCTYCYFAAAEEDDCRMRAFTASAYFLATQKNKIILYDNSTKKAPSLHVHTDME